MDTNQKRNQLISKVSRNIHTRIHLKHVLSKYYQYIAALSLYDVRLWTPHHLLLSFVYHCIAKAETDPKTWYFVARFSAHCLASTYDGNTLLTQMNEYEDKEDTIIGFGGNITKMIYSNIDVKLLVTLWINDLAGEWISGVHDMGPRSWEHVSCALTHELYAPIASSLNVIVNRNREEYSKLSDRNIDIVLNRLKKRSKMDAAEMEYIKQLIHRVISSRSEHSTVNKSLDIEWKIDGLDPQTFCDIYNVHNCFLFANYRCAIYDKDIFKKEMIKQINCTHLEKVVDNMIQQMPSIDLYPQYIIDDGLHLIWSYFFAATHLAHKVRNTDLDNQSFAVKIVVIPKRIISICNEKNIYPDGMRDIYNYLMIEKNVSQEEVYMDVICFANNETDPTRISKQMTDLFARAYRDDSDRKKTKQNDILIVVDRRQNMQKNKDKIYIISNCDVRIFSELHAQYNISLHFDIAEDITRCYLYYGLHPKHKMRFFPELLTSIVPRFFKKDEKLNGYQRVRLLFDDKYKHGFALQLSDATFEKYYKCITQYTHVSVNYDRNVIQQKSNLSQESEYKCSIDHPVGIDECVFIDYIIFCLNSSQDINDIDTIRLTKCYTHIICVHSFCLDPEKRLKIKKYVSDMVGECPLQSECPSIRHHTQRAEFRGQQHAAQNTILPACLSSLHCYLLHDGEVLFRLRSDSACGRYASQNPLQFVDKMDEFIESAMLHTKEDTFVRKLLQWMQLNAYDWDSLEMDMKCSVEGNIYHFLRQHDKQMIFDPLRTEYINDSAVAAINFGISVLMWFKSPSFRSKYASLRDEMLNNKFSKMTEKYMAIYEEQCNALLNTNQTYYQYTLDEILSLKVYTDETDLTSKFRSAFWQTSSQEMKMEFYIWAMTIYRTASYHARPLPVRMRHSGKDYPVKLHHGISEVFAVHDRSPKYNGPVSTTVESCVAETFSKGTGLLWYIITNYLNRFKFVKGINVDWISRFKHEGEILLNDQYLYIGETHYYIKDKKLKVDHLLHQLKIYKDKIIEIKIFWKQIGFEVTDDMMPFIRDNPLLMQHSAYKPYGYDEYVKVIERLVQELGIHDEDILNEYLIKCAIPGVDDMLQRLLTASGKITLDDKALFLTQNGMIFNGATLLCIQNNPLLFKYSAYDNYKYTIFERLINDLGAADLPNNYFAVNPQNCKINAVLNGLIVYKTKIELDDNKFWKGIADAIQNNKTILAVIRKHPLLIKPCEYKRYLRQTFVLERLLEELGINDHLLYEEYLMYVFKADGFINELYITKECIISLHSVASIETRTKGLISKCE
eukprot:731769_1